MLTAILILLLFGFLGYFIGRLSHCYFNVWVGDPKWIPHHWTCGLGLMIIGLIYQGNSLMALFFSFGLGLLISDLDDFLELRFFSPDGNGKKVFWGID